MIKRGGTKWHARYLAEKARADDAEAELDRYKAEAEATAQRTFPILLHYRRKNPVTLACPTSVPWGFIEQYGRTAKQNHRQTIERLAERGGLSPAEMMAVITNDTKWWDEPEEKAVRALKDAVAEYKREASGYAILEAERDQYKTEAEHLRRSAEMACENPPDDCGCPGCGLAREEHGVDQEAP